MKLKSSAAFVHSFPQSAEVPSRAPPAWGVCDVNSFNPEICDGEDDNCNGQSNEGCPPATSCTTACAARLPSYGAVGLETA